MTAHPHDSLPPPPPPPGGGAPLLPPEVGTIRIFLIVSLVVNALATASWLLATIVGGAATCGLGCLLIVLPAISGVAAALDASAYSKLNHPPTPYVAGAVKNAAILDIVAGAVTMSLVPLAMGILLLVFLQKPEVSSYFNRGGGRPSR